MSKQNKILVGKIVGVQGLRGEIRVQSYTENSGDFAWLDASIWANNIRPKQFRFVRALPNSTVVIARIDGIDNRTAAESLRGTELFIDRDTLPLPDENEYYIADLIGMNVGGRKVAAVHNFGAGDILELDDGEMLSFTGAKVDVEKREIILHD
ncbi:MAG: ribosome maturation factor RimM [Alphaproteobacteria bacterium]|nr:ribosome maturation factor RimM [Alphaproteobacteria bacterium]